MVGFDVDLKPLESQRAALEAALSSNPETGKRLRKFIRSVLKDAREHMISDAGAAMNSDPRAARYSIRSAVYKAILGGNVNIFNSRKAGRPTSYVRPRKLDKNPHQRGGNRIRKSAETARRENYGPHDRGFILRFVNAGAGTKSPRESRYGNRGSIAARNWFGPSAERWVQQAADNLNAIIYAEVAKMMNETK